MMRKLFVLTVLTAVFVVAGGAALADPNLSLQAQPHRHYIQIGTTLAEVGPRYCDNLDSEAIKAAFTEFHANTHTHNGVTGEIGPVAPGLHNGAGAEITSGPC
jgi:hypothetical protein